MPLIITTPYISAPIGWELMSTSAPFNTNASGARPTWLLSDDTVLVGPASGISMDVAIYTPSTDSWVLKNDFDSGSPANPPTTFPYGGIVHPVSGNPVMSARNAVPAPDHGEMFEYIPGLDAWNYLADWPDRNAGADVTNLNTGEIFIASTSETANRDLTEKWDGTTFTSTANIPQPWGSPAQETRGANALHTADDGTVYHFGGQQWPVTYSSDQILKYNPTLNTWSLSSVTLPTELKALNTCRLSGNRVMFLGGTHFTSVDPQAFVKSVWILDMTTETFTQMANDFAEPAVPGGLDIGYQSPGSNAVQLANGKVMVLYTDNEVYITTAPI